MENKEKNQGIHKIDVAFLLRLKTLNKKIFKEKDIYIYSFITDRKINKHKIIDITLWHGNHLVYAEQAGLVVFKMKGFSMQDKSGVYFTDINEIMKNILDKMNKEYDGCADVIVKAEEKKIELKQNLDSIKNYFTSFEGDKKELQKIYFDTKQNYFINKVENE